MARLPPDLAAGGGDSTGDTPPLRERDPGVGGNGGVLARRSSSLAVGAVPAMRDLNFCTAPSTENSTTPIATKPRNPLPKKKERSPKKN